MASPRVSASRVPPARREASRMVRRAPDPAALIIVGEITRPHGAHGMVRVLPVTDFPDHLLGLTHVAVVQGEVVRQVQVQRAEAAGRFVVMKLSGVETPEAAEALRGATLRIPPGEARPLPPGQHYVFQIVGLRVSTVDGRVLGRVADVLRTGSNDVYVVRPECGPEVLLPAVEGVVQRIDVEAGEMIVIPPEWM
jgi:16S rRNA processing protein RimM